MQQSMKETFDVAVSLAGTARTTTANGTSIDLQNFNAATAVVVPTAWTDGTHTLKLQDSPDGSSWTDVAAAQLDGSMPAISAGGGSPTRVGYLGTARYLRAVTTVTGSPATGAVYTVLVLRGHARKLPK